MSPLPALAFDIVYSPYCVQSIVRYLYFQKRIEMVCINSEFGKMKLFFVILCYYAFRVMTVTLLVGSWETPQRHVIQRAAKSIP